MRTAFAAISLASLAIAAPVKPDIDGTVLNFALTLEHLEASFYKASLENFSADDFAAAGHPAWVRERVSEIASHESSHVQFLTGALTAAGVAPVPACEYDLSSVTDVASFLATARVLEGVGVAAYLGAAGLITNVDYLTYAGAILTVEARHNAWIRGAALPLDSFPSAYESYLTPTDVYTLAAPFFSSCPAAAALPFKANPVFTVASVINGKPNDGLCTGDVITLYFKNLAAGKYNAVFIQTLGNVLVPFTKVDGQNPTVTIPAASDSLDLFGQIYLTVAAAGDATAATIQGPVVLELPLQNREFPLATVV